MAIMMKGKHQRLVLILAALVAMLGAAALAASALRDQAAYFYTPSDARSAKVEPGRAVRLGGMVQPGSIVRSRDGLSIRFVVSDGKASVPATFSGITPDLFKEGSGVVAEGSFDASGTFVADNVLAKHDERYMPRELEGISYDPKTHTVDRNAP
jgi:cytochrome c-type biogenesis protein CcmE